MSGFFLAIGAYFLIALETILDKFLLTSKRVSHPANYAFYSGVMSFFALAFFYWGFHIILAERIVFYLIPGIIFTYGILFLFFAIEKNEASQVIPLVGAVIPIIIFFIFVFFLKEKLNIVEITGVIFLIAGGFWLSFNMRKNVKGKFFDGFYSSILSGLFLAVAFSCFKQLYNQDNFINVYIWTRLGVMLGALSLLFVPAWRRKIFQSFSNFKKPSEKNRNSGVLFVATKALGGLGSILKEKATSLGSIIIVNSLISIEYVFIFVLGIVFSFYFPMVFQEKKDVKNAFQKLTAIALITIGIILVSGLN